MLYRIRVWDCLFSIWVIMLYRIRVWEGFFSIWVIMLYRLCWGGGGGGGSSAVERATPGEEVPDSIPALAARPLLVGSVSV